MKRYLFLLPVLLSIAFQLPPNLPAGKTYPAPDGRTVVIVSNIAATSKLWLVSENQSPQLLLDTTGELIGEVAWRADSQTIAFIRTPLGANTDAQSEVWRLDLPTAKLTRLTQNNLPNHTPRWSADGENISVAQGTRRVILAADQLSVDNTPSPAIDFSSLRLTQSTEITAPIEIRVIHRQPPEYDCRTDVISGTIDSIPFEEYVKRVLPNEMPALWDTEALKAQAVAARTYAWNHYLQNPSADWHVTDWVDYQYMCDNDTPNYPYYLTDAAVDATAGEYLAVENVPILAMYSAENSSPTKDNIYADYLEAVDDPVSFGQTRNGHGYGLSQWGAQRWASQYNWEYTAILRHYYWDVKLKTSHVITETAPPKVALVEPWHNFYVTGNRLGVRFNMFDGSSAITETALFWTTPLTTENILWTTGTEDSASLVIESPVLTDGLPVTLTAVITDASGKTTESSPVVIGVDRSDPAAQWTTGSAVLTGTLALSPTIEANDEGSGVSLLAVGQSAWEWTTNVVGGTGEWAQPAIILPTDRKYRAYFRLKSDNAETTAEIAQVMALASDGRLIGLHRLRGIDFRTADEYQEFHIDFVSPSDGQVNFSVIFDGGAILTLDRFIVLNYPIPYQNALPSGYIGNLRLKVIDNAGNVSNDLMISRPFQYIYLPIVLK